MGTLATRMAFGKRLMELGAENPDFVVCSADTKACGIEHFGEKYPGREFRFGIAEQDLLGGAVGLASCGNKVFVATFAVFATMRVCEQVRTFVCHTGLNVTIVGTHTGLQVGCDGATHAAVEDVGIMRSLPHMTIIQPSDSISAYSLADAALAFKGPLYVRLHRNPVPDMHEPDFKFEIGKVYTLRDNGNDAAIMASGILTAKAVQAADELKAEGINVKVLEIPTIKPLNKEPIIEAAKACGCVVTVEDHNIYNGLGSAIAEVLVEKCPMPMQRIGIPDCFGESASDPEDLYKEHGMTVADIKAAVKAQMARK